MTNAALEKRIAALEAEVAALKARSGGEKQDQRPWWRAVAGIFEDDPAFEEAMRLGREYRESLRPKPRRTQKKSG
ncbi:MAG TPA: hypothetical protein VGP72_29045 [Planctomycetota bacterium]|jgi:hypothetical protein